MAIALSLLAALAYGAADFVGGFVTKRNEVLRVVLLSQLFGTVPLVLAFPLVNDGRFSSGAMFWGALAGVAGGTGVALLYRGLARGRMSVVAPITSVEAAAIPVLFGLFVGERPSTAALLGVGIALLAVGLISMTPEPTADPERDGTGIPEGIGAGLAFAAFFILLDKTGDDTGMWPLLAVRGASMSLIAVGVLATRTSLRVASGTMWGIVVSGVLDVAANIFYLMSTREGLLSLVAVITSMYPAVTVLLARIVLAERLVRIQIVGLVMAGAGIVLIATG